MVGMKSSRLISRLWLLVFGASVLCESAQAQLHDELSPRRKIGSGVVDITPAMEWRKEAAKLQMIQREQTNRLFVKRIRPLPEWVLVEGGITNKYEWGGWVVAGRVDGQKAVFVLRNPPSAEFDEFNRLKEETAELRKRRDTYSKARQDAGSQVFRAVTKSEARAGASGYNEAAARDMGLNLSFSMTLGDEIRKKSKGYNLDREFPVRCYAMRTGQQCEGLPVYDRGVVLGGTVQPGHKKTGEVVPARR
jgi:hypothetical protein